MKLVYQSFCRIAGMVVCCFFMAENLSAQSFLYVETDNLIEIELPNVPLSVIGVKASGGTIEKIGSRVPPDFSGDTTLVYHGEWLYEQGGKRKGRNIEYKWAKNKTYWVAYPEKENTEFEISVGINIGSGFKVFATKKYALKTAYFIDVRKNTHILTTENLMKDDIILSNNKMGSIFNLVFRVKNGQSATLPLDHFQGRLSGIEKRALRKMKSGDKMFIKFSNGKNIELIRE